VDGVYPFLISALKENIYPVITKKIRLDNPILTDKPDDKLGHLFLYSLVTRKFDVNTRKKLNQRSIEQMQLKYIDHTLIV